MENPKLSRQFAANSPSSPPEFGHKKGAKVAGLVIMPRDDGRYGLLLVKRQAGARIWWEPPGGSVEAVDTSNLRKATTREILEETGVYAPALFKLPHQYLTPRGRSVAFFWCEYISGQARNAAAEEHLDVEVVVPEEFEIKEIVGRKQAYLRGSEVQMPIQLVEGLKYQERIQLGNAAGPRLANG